MYGVLAYKQEKRGPATQGGIIGIRKQIHKNEEIEKKKKSKISNIGQSMPTLLIQFPRIQASSRTILMYMGRRGII